MKKYNYTFLEEDMYNALKAYHIKGFKFQAAKDLTEAAIEANYPPIAERILFGKDNALVLDELEWGKNKINNFIKQTKLTKLNQVNYLNSVLPIKGFGPFRNYHISSMLGGKNSPRTLNKMVKLSHPKRQGYVDLYAAREKGIGDWSVKTFEEHMENYDPLRRIKQSYKMAMK